MLMFSDLEGSDTRHFRQDHLERAIAVDLWLAQVSLPAQNELGVPFPKPLT